MHGTLQVIFITDGCTFSFDMARRQQASENHSRTVLCGVKTFAGQLDNSLVPFWIGSTSPIKGIGVLLRIQTCNCMICEQDFACGQYACCSFSGGGMGPQVPILGSKRGSRKTLWNQVAPSVRCRS